MTTLFLVNNAAIGNAATPTALPDPVGARWFKEGDEQRTPSGRLRSLAWEGVELLWDPIYSTQFKALMDYFLGLVSGGLTVTSITVPSRRGHTGTVYWQTYTAPDSRNIWPDAPEGQAEATVHLGVIWRFRRVKPALAA